VGDEKAKKRRKHEGGKEQPLVGTEKCYRKKGGEDFRKAPAEN